MTDIFKTVKSLNRPSLLIRAARIGLVNYNRKRDLGKIVRDGKVPAYGKALPTLISVENQMEGERLKGDTSYSIANHVLVLIALMAETGFAQARME